MVGLATLPALLLTGIVTGPLLIVVASVFVPLFREPTRLHRPDRRLLTAGRSGPELRHLLFAGFGLGSTGGVIAGALVDRWDTQAAFLGLSVFMALSVALSMLLFVMAERPGPSDRTRGRRST